MEKFANHLQNTISDCGSQFFEALAAAAHDCATEIGLPVALEDDAVAALLSAAGHHTKVPERQRLGIATGLHAFPTGQWSYHSPALRMFCTAATDPRPQPAWDDCLWLLPHALLTREPRETTR